MCFNDIVENIVRFSIEDKDGRVLKTFSAGNNLTYAAGTVLINALLRSGPSQIGYLYARYGNNQGSPPSGTLILPTGGIKAVTRANFIQSSGPDQGALWVPVLGAPLVTTSNSAYYSNNVATFSFRIPANLSTAAMSPIGSFNAATAYITAVGLAVPVSTSDRTQDIIISVLDDYALQQVPAGGQMGVDYPFKITP